MLASNLSTAICRFDDWGNPWRFEQFVTAFLDRSDADLFQQIWREANDASHWTESDLSACATRAASALQSRFPFLDSEVSNAVANAAAYQWR